MFCQGLWLFSVVLVFDLDVKRGAIGGKCKMKKKSARTWSQRETNFNFYLIIFWIYLRADQKPRSVRKKLLMKNLVCKIDLHNVLCRFFFSCVVLQTFMNIQFELVDINLHREERHKRRDKIRLSLFFSTLRDFQHVTCITNLPSRLDNSSIYQHFDAVNRFPRKRRKSNFKFVKFLFDVLAFFSFDVSRSIKTCFRFRHHETIMIENQTSVIWGEARETKQKRIWWGKHN